MKLLLNLCLIAAGAIPRGGVITVEILGEDDAMTLRVEAKGANARISHGAAEALTREFPAETIDARSIQPYFTALLAVECRATLSATASPDTLTLIAAPATVAMAVELQ